MRHPVRGSARVEVAVWLLILAGLLAGIGYETDWGRRWVWPVAQPQPTLAAFASPQLTPPFALQPPDAYLETALRPLFVPTRRPAPALPDTPKQSMKKGQFVLTGTTIVGTAKFAHLVDKAGGKTHVVAEGKEINGIVVRQVTPTQVILAQGNETEAVMLQVDKPLAAAGTRPQTTAPKSASLVPQTGAKP